MLWTLSQIAELIQARLEGDDRQLRIHQQAVDLRIGAVEDLLRLDT